MKKKCYYMDMENTNEINRKIANNLIRYRKAAGMTQAELAEKINYSDKSVSKWESGNGVPDVYTLIQIANLFGVTLNDLVGDEASQPVLPTKKSHGLHVLIMLLSSGIVWLVATCIFVAVRLFNPDGAGWLAFVYAVVANAIVMIVYASIWKYRVLNFISVSTLVWMALTSIYLTARLICIRLGNNYEGVWTVYLLGVPLQVLEILWMFFRSLFTKNKEKKARVQSMQETAEEETDSKEEA